MTTKNIQDVVAERVEKAVIRLAATGCFEGKGDEILQPYADWLTTTLTQLVKEVEAGERGRCDKRIRKEAQAHVTRKIAHGKAMYEKGKKERD